MVVERHLDGDEEAAGAHEALQSGQRCWQVLSLGTAQHDVRTLEVIPYMHCILELLICCYPIGFLVTKLTVSIYVQVLVLLCGSWVCGIVIRLRYSSLCWPVLLLASKASLCPVMLCGSQVQCSRSPV